MYVPRSYHRGISPVILLCAMPTGILIVISDPYAFGAGSPPIIVLPSGACHCISSACGSGYQCKSTVSEARQGDITREPGLGVDKNQH